MFSQIELTNFRAVAAPLRLPLKPLTVLVGENGSGKTSVLQALALTAQSATEQPRMQDLVVQGTKWVATDVKEVYHGHDANQALSIGLTLDVDSARLPNDIGKSARWPGFPSWPPSTFTYTWTRLGADLTVWSHRYALDQVRIWDWRGEIVGTDPRFATTKQEAWVLATDGTYVGPLIPIRPLDRVLPPQMFAQPEQVFQRQPAAAQPEDPKGTKAAVRQAFQEAFDRPTQDAADVLRPLSEDMRNRLDRVLMIDPLRGKDLILSVTGDAVSAGRHGENLLQLLTSLRVRRGKTFERFRAWADKFGLPSVEAGSQNNQLDLSAMDRSGTSVRYTEFATGSLQGLLIAAQILLAQPHSVLLIEEPEANMHPAFERLLADLFAEGVKLGHQIILSTHSEILVAAVGGVVRRGVLTADQVGIVEMTRADSALVAQPLEVTPRGLAEWVKSFSKVEAALSEEWADGIPEER